VFAGAPEAVATALTIQRTFAAESWQTPHPIKVRIGVHTGEAELRDGDYYGSAVNHCARIRGIGHGGQILLSEATMALARDDLSPGVTLIDLGEHRLKDLTRPERVFQPVCLDLPSDFPPLMSLDALPNNLPRQLTRFIGREREIEEVTRLLATTSLLTLVGSGGAGKTRLALQVAADLLDAYPDGVWLVELAPLSDPSLVPQAVAAALSVREQAGRPVLDTLAEHLRARSLLLVIDNCEHLVASCAVVVESLLRACPGLRVLATSREGLGIAGETIWRIPSLSLPDPGGFSAEASDVVARLTQFEAVRLFVDRALAVAPDFSVTNQNAPAVAQICTHLDGIPLAIELAAARVRLLTPDQIAARLDDRFRLLTGGSRTALPRQQTLRALVDWSHDLLSEPERVLLRRLSVFAGSWTLEAAEAVCAGERIDAFDILDLLAQLVDKSLVIGESRGEETRYRLLETLRQYGAEKLAAADETETLRGRHRDWFVRFAERETALLRSPRQTETFGQLIVEYDNLRAALDWSLSEPGGAEIASRLANRLLWFWALQGKLVESYVRLNILLSQVDDRSPVRARTLVAAGYLAHHTGDYARAGTLLEEGVSIWREVGGKADIATALMLLGRLELTEQHFERAWSLLSESRDLFREAGGEVIFDAPLAVFMAQVAKERGDHENAIPLFEECLATARAQGDAHTASSVLRSLGELTQLRGDFDQAQTHLAESLRLILALDDRSCAVTSLNSLANLDVERGILERAVRLFAAADAIREANGSDLAPALKDRRDRGVAAARSQLTDTVFESAWAEGSGMSMAAAIGYALRGAEGAGA